jgi:broad specificity phosphatase PhoE
MKIILIRHGETEQNVQGILQGHLDGDLTERGRQQIDKLAERLAEEKIDRIMSSDLKRATITAEQIAKYHGLKVELDSALRERSLGIFDGRPLKELQDYLNASPDRLRTPPPQGESVEQVVIRAERFLQTLIAKSAFCNQTVLISAHGLINRAFISLFLGSPLESVYGYEQENTCVSEILVHYPQNSKPYFELHFMNCTKHLNEDNLVRRGRTNF